MLGLSFCVHRIRLWHNTRNTSSRQNCVRISPFTRRVVLESERSYYRPTRACIGVDCQAHEKHLVSGRRRRRRQRRRRLRRRRRRQTFTSVVSVTKTRAESSGARQIVVARSIANAVVVAASVVVVVVVAQRTCAERWCHALVCQLSRTQTHALTHTHTLTQTQFGHDQVKSANQAERAREPKRREQYIERSP